MTEPSIETAEKTKLIGSSTNVSSAGGAVIRINLPPGLMRL